MITSFCAGAGVKASHSKALIPLPAFNNYLLTTQEKSLRVESCLQYRK